MLSQIPMCVNEACKQHADFCTALLSHLFSLFHIVWLSNGPHLFCQKLQIKENTQGSNCQLTTLSGHSLLDLLSKIDILFSLLLSRLNFYPDPFYSEVAHEYRELTRELCWS